ncbi:FLU1-II [Rickenella mellea]|uniref:Glutamine synthetase n=1 Tax=Rickenella mellea TaxID=50990 RepID=A0A4Y7QB72_9AGAM|nr:FLU1-II [Rickenella mellea]
MDISAGHFNPSDKATLLEKLNRIAYVRVTWVDYANFVRYRVVPVAHIKKLLASKRPGVTLTKATLGLVYIQLVPGFGSSGEYLYVFDPNSLRTLGYGSRPQATMMGWLEEKEPVASPRDEESKTVIVPLCPRELLRKIVAAAKSTHGIDFLMGFETEFILLKSTNPITAVNNYGWSESAAMSAGTVETKALDEMADALAFSDIELQMYHAEAAPGQFEIVTGPLPPLEAVDALIVTRETIFNIATKHGLKATLAPRVYMENCGSASHVHMSLRSSTPSSPAQVPSAPSLTQLEASFLQGLLDHLQGVTAFSLPTPSSYARMVDGVWSGGTWVAWGRDNRECPVRLCGSTGDHHFEVKCLDGTANPYLAISAMLASGMMGVRSASPLVVRDCQALAASLTEDQRTAIGVTKRMPLNIEEARDYLKADSALVSAMGEELVEKYLAVNEVLGKALEAGTPEEALRRLVETY